MKVNKNKVLSFERGKMVTIIFKIIFGIMSLIGGAFAIHSVRGHYENGALAGLIIMYGGAILAMLEK